MTYDDSGLFVCDEDISAYAASLARSGRADGYCSGRDAAARLRRGLRELASACGELSSRWNGAPGMPGAVRWLLDNCYIARREGLDATAALAGAGRLPSREGVPMLLLLCGGFVRCSHLQTDEGRLALFLEGWQSVSLLSRRELELLGAGLRAGLIAELVPLARRLRSGDADAVPEGAMKSIFTSLRELSSADLTELTDAADAAEQTLLRDPAGVYPLMDRPSRRYYRAELERIAQRRGITAQQAARRVLELSQSGAGLRRHVGFWILRRPLGDEPASRSGAGYISALLLPTLAISLFAGFKTGSVLAALLLLLPVSELVKTLADTIVLRLVRPVRLPCLRLKDGVPGEGRTLCVITELITGSGSAAELKRRLEETMLVSRDCGKNLLFAALADLPDTKNEHEPDCEAGLRELCRAVEELNARYSGGFFVLTRPRTRVGSRYMGRERKRGAIEETLLFLRGEKSPVYCAAGDVEQLHDIKLLLTLDSDTRLTPGSARRLIGAMLHPMNRPELDREKRVVRAGHGVIAPRIAVELPCAVRSDFTRVFAGPGGCDPYAGSRGEVYMDLFSSGGFAGKGVIDIDAYLFCMSGRIPENRVLSHDALEGAFLRGGYMSDVEVTDGFPAGPLSYYKRMHRWVRGDWQNAPWLFLTRGRALASIERLRLFDSLRRSLVPVMTLAALCAGFLFPDSGAAAAAAAALVTCLSQLLLGAGRRLFRDESELRLRYHSRVLSGPGGGLVTAAIRLILLPVEALFCLDAILRALWRMLVSHKKLLEWQTAGQSDRQGAGLWATYSRMWPASVLGLLLTLLSPSVIGRAAGVIWLFSPACAYVLGIPDEKAPPLSRRGREYLLGAASDMWKYFDGFMTEEDNFLPPDNFQAQPPVGLAHRTSPTNIGLALLSAAAACELGICTPERADELTERCLDTVERLGKWRGHLYNWYDTRTLEPLRPAYVSTVDSGNLIACLIALGGALRARGNARLAERAERLAGSMELGPLYDRKRRLFSIGADPETGEKTQSWYDLMESEARLTDYIAIARGEAPMRLWRRLSRAQAEKNGYRGMVSWTGTMFEYLMPELMLPLYDGSLLYESARFCLYVQKKRTAGSGRPWGVSESAFYSLDPAMSYRYKAHGCAALALRRGMDAELVVSPYSSFLALTLRPAEAVRNLRRLGALGMRGPYGLWEAADYSRKAPGASGPDIVRCVMAHHLGMSIVAAANCLLGGVMQRHFMSDGAMSAYRCLLQESVPTGGQVLRRKTQEPPARQLRGFDESWEKHGTDIDWKSPEMCLLSGMAYDLAMTETGAALPAWGRIMPYLASKAPGGHGLDIVLRTGAEETPLLPAPGTDARRAWRFTPEKAEFFTDTDGFSARTVCFAAKDEPSEMRRVTLLRRDGTESEAGELCLRFTPVLAQERDYYAHPAFCKLGLSARTENGALLIRRLPRGECGELFLCLACDRPARFSSVPGAESGRPYTPHGIGDEEYFLVEPLIECAVTLECEAEQTVSFALSMAKTAEDALEGARRFLASGEDGAGDMARRAAAVIGLDRAGFERACALLPALCFPTPPLPDGDYRRGELWKFGISGDLPIICAEFTAPEQLDRARQLMDSHLLLCGCGRDADLVFITHDGAGYRKPLDSALEDALWRSGGDLLSGARGGVHIIDDSAGAKGVRSCAALRIDLGEPERERERDTSALPARRRPRRGGTLPEYSNGADGSFILETDGLLPRRMWTNILTNGRMSFIAADCGSGGMWQDNSRENPIAPWYGLPLETAGPERLELETEAGRHSLFGGDGRCRIEYGFGYAAWETRHGPGTVRVTAFIPPETDARVLLIEPEGIGAAQLHWSLELQLSPEKDDARYVVTSHAGGVLRAQNSRGIAPDGVFSALSEPAFSAFTCSAESAAAGGYDGKTGVFARSVFSARLGLSGAAVIVCGLAGEAGLRSLASPERARAALGETKRHWAELLGRLRISTPCPELDRLMNGWAAYQALACRVMARGSIYQSGGAYGFRDQLQDTVNLIALDPAYARGQLLRSCRRQYLEGDVQHWWHEGGGAVRGVRTRCSDDLLWLPWAVCEYVEKTGDSSVCFEKAPYLSSQPLSTGERDRYEQAEETAEAETVLMHCRRSLDRVLERGTGRNGLLLIGSGDWNDGFDGVRGESQWLTWFFCCIAPRFAALADAAAPGTGKPYREAAWALLSAAERAWDGEWYRRGYYADGAPLGSAECSECRIDSIAQSFAAFCPGTDEKRVKTALRSAYERLFDRKNGIVRLFDPPFSGRGRDPGYIKSYGPGFRENGGQYTHGAVWLASAMLKTGLTGEGWELLRALLPSGRDSMRYGGEPYVIPADVYSAPGHEGEAGWTWYTGSAGWLLRVVCEDLLGLRLEGGRLVIRPSLPAGWDGYEADFHGRHIRVSPDGITVDGKSYDGGAIAL